MPNVDVLMAARFERDQLRGVLWDETAALRIVTDAATDLTVDVCKTIGEMQPINLDREPEIASLLGQLEVKDLVAPS